MCRCPIVFSVPVLDEDKCPPLQAQLETSSSSLGGKGEGGERSTRKTQFSFSFSLSFATCASEEGPVLGKHVRPKRVCCDPSMGHLYSSPRPLSLFSSNQSADVTRGSSQQITLPLAPRAAAPLPTEELLLPEGWRQTLPKEQHLWVSKALFTRDSSGRLALTKSLRLCWFPPCPRPLYSQPPSSPDVFFHTRLFLWVPYRMWAYRLLYSKPTCRRLGVQLTACGIYKTVRRVLDDVVRMMRGRTLGNSATALYNQLCIRHREHWVAQSAEYLSVLGKFMTHVTDRSRLAARIPQMVPVPCPGWLLSVYAKDVLTRLPELKARVTSIYGSILKLDSTKKVTKKLAGEAAGTAAWVTDVGNEFGQVLMCVLTEAEGDGLLPMCSGLVERYRRAGEAPPEVLYVDRDCCSSTGKGKAAAVFAGGTSCLSGWMCGTSCGDLP
ncbi:unnamed protein product [Leuciscus chuanchicus]